MQRLHPYKSPFHGGGSAQPELWEMEEQWVSLCWQRASQAAGLSRSARSPRIYLGRGVLHKGGSSLPLCAWDTCVDGRKDRAACLLQGTVGCSSALFLPKATLCL